MATLTETWYSDYHHLREWTRQYGDSESYHQLFVRWWPTTDGKGSASLVEDLIPTVEAAYSLDSELFPLARSCEFAQPVVDWLLENSHTPEQKALADALERTLGAGVGR